MNEIGILRRWSSRIRTSDEEAYVANLQTGVLGDYPAMAGNLGAELLMRRLLNGTTEVTMLSRWDSVAAIAALADPEFEMTRHQGKDRQLLLGKPRAIELHRVVAKSAKPPIGDEAIAYGRNPINY